MSKEFREAVVEASDALAKCSRLALRQNNPLRDYFANLFWEVSEVIDALPVENPADSARREGGM